MARSGSCPGLLTILLCGERSALPGGAWTAALRRFSDGIQRRLRRAVWSQGGCTSWYLDADGVNGALWPGFSFEYWARTRRARAADYAIG